MGVETIGVDQERLVHLLRDRTRKVERGVGAPEARSQHQRSGSLRQLLHLVDAGGSVAAVLFRQRARHSLEQLEL